MKKFLSLVLALVMTMSLVTVSAGAKDFTDNGSITYKEAVEVMSAVKVIDGYTDGSFQPTTNLTRGAAAKIICNLILGPTTASALGADTAPYSDVPTTNTFAGYIAYCQKEGIISGYADGTFRPSAPLTGYAFMKMLLGALGYDSTKEGYTGANWSVNVAKQAIAIGLDDGNDDFVGQASVNREEAMLYAFNAMQATMVEYGNDTTITVGDVVVSQSGKATEVVNTASNETIKNDDKMQFAEKYFSDLKLVNGTDAFARPANIWKVKSDEVGTYAKTADATYTEKVDVGDIYKDLGLGKTVAKSDVSVYEDGEKTDEAVAITKGDDDNSYGANGVLTQVYYDSDDETVTITKVNTYVGTINRSVAASGNNDRYIEVNPESQPDGGINKKFETNEEFEDDAYVLYTYSVSEKSIESVKVAESAEGTVTKIVAGKSVNLGDTTYKFNAVYAAQLPGDTPTTDNDYTVYLDENGYVVYVEEQEFVSSDYALMIDAQGSGTFESNKAKLVFADGTDKVVETAKNYDKAVIDGGIEDNSIVTYKVDEDGVYTLRAVKTTQKVIDSENFVLTNGKARMELKDNNSDTDTNDAGEYAYSNSKTVFVVDKLDGDYEAYTGTNNAPGIKASTGANEKVTAYYYCKSGDMVTVMFIKPGSDLIVENNSKNVLFIAGASASKLISTSDSDYYEYNAVVNGEVTTVKVDKNVVGVADASEIANSLYSSYSVDSHGVITKLNPYTTTGDKYADTAAGTAKVSGEYTVKLGSVAYTVAEDANIYFVDKDGVISATSVNGIAKDPNDPSNFIVDDGQIVYLFIQEKDDDATDEPEYGETDSRLGVEVDLENSTIKFLISGEDNFSLAEKIAAVKNAVAKELDCDVADVKVTTKGSAWTISAPGVDSTECTASNIVNAITVADRDTHRAYAADVVKAWPDGGYEWCVELNDSNFVTYDVTVTTTGDKAITVSGKVSGFDVATKDVPGFTEAGHSIAQDQTQLANATKFAIVAFYDNAGAAWYSIVGNGSYEGPATVTLNSVTYTINWDLTW